MNVERAVSRIDDADLEEVAGEVWTDEHHQRFVELFSSDRIVERVADRFVGHTMLAGARRDAARPRGQVTLLGDVVQGNLSRPAIDAAPAE